LGLSLGALCCTLVLAEDLVRFTSDVPGDSKPIVLHADQMATWIENGQRVILARGKVLVEHGVVQARMQQAVAWIDQDRHRRTGIFQLEVYGEDNVILESGPETRTAAKALISLSTRGEIKLKSVNGKVNQQPQTSDPLYRRGRDVHSPQAKTPSSGAVRQASFQEVLPLQPATPPGQPAPGADTPRLAPGAPINPQQPPVSATPAVPAPSVPPTWAAPQPGPQNAVPNSPAGPPAPPVTAPQGPPASPTTPGPPGPGPPPVPGTRPSLIGFPPAAPLPGPNGVVQGPARQFSIVPRTLGGFEPQSFPLGNGEHVVVVTGGVILIVRSSDNSSLLDVEADRLVFWTRGNPQQLLSNLRTPQGQTSRELEFYLAGNVEIRQRNGPREHTLKADEVYYDVGRNVAVAMHADIEFRQPGLPDPVHVKSEEFLQLSPTLFRGMKSEIFSSRLPSDPGLKIYVTDVKVEEKDIPRRSIFGRQVTNRVTGLPEIEHQQLFDSTNVYLEFEDVPFFYLPFLQGDANDPLGPLENVSFNANRIFGAQISTTFNVYDLLGITPYPGTRWRLDLDYLTSRGPAAGSTFEYAGKSFFEMPATVTGQVKGYGIYDTGTDILGGGRGPDDHHPEGRGRFLWQQNVQDLPQGFSLQTQVSVLSDKNFLEQYYKNEFDTGINQETFAYLKQQQGNWAWTLLTEVNIRNWVDETEWLPRADGYLIGQSFFDFLTYNAHASAGYARLRPTDVPPPPESFTTRADNTVRLDLNQELSAPFTLGAFRIVPYGLLDLTYYSEDLTGNDRGRVYGGGGVRSSIPFSRLYPDVQSELLNVNGIYHKIVVSSNYFIAQSDTSFSRLPQLDRLNDDASDQSLRDIKPLEPLFNPAHGLALLTSPVYDPQLYAIRRLVDDRIDTLDTIEELQGDIRQRWQTKRGYPGQQHIVDWMTLDLSATFFPHPTRDNFGSNFAFLEYDWIWNIGDRTALVSSGWLDPEDNGPRIFSIGAFLNRPDRTSFFLGYRQIDPLDSQAVTGSVTYIFSPKYALTAAATFDFGINSQTTMLALTRMGSDLQITMGLTYNSLVNTFGFTFEILPNIVPPSHRVPGLAALSPAGFGGLGGH
jgi:hypothetical protein